jgi:hypothetical protein
VHPWIGTNEKVPLDILVYRLVRNYLRSSSMKRAALKVSNRSPHYELWVLHTVHRPLCIRFLTEDNITVTNVYTLMDLQLCKLIRARIYLAKSWVLEMAEPNFNFVQDFDKKITRGFIFLALPQALSKTLMEEDLVYLRAQFLLLEPNKNGRVTFENFRTVHFQTCHFPYLFFPFQELLFKQLLRVFLRVLAAQNGCILISGQLGSLESILCLIINRNGLYPKTVNRYLELGRCIYKLFKS